MTTHVLPMALPSVANLREHWKVRATRAKAHRSAARVKLGRCEPHASWLGLGGVVVVTLTRVAARPLDDDNLASAAKSLRDGVADALGVTDRHPHLTWRYRQERTKPKTLPFVRIQLEDVVPV